MRAGHPSARAAITQCHCRGGLTHRQFFSPSSGGYKSKIRVLAGLVSPEVSALGLQMDTSSLCTEKDISGLSSSSHEDTPYQIRATLTTSFNPHDLKGPISKYSHLGGSGVII